MRFYDANLSFGILNNVDEQPLLPCPSAEVLAAALKRAGVTGGLVRAEVSDISGVNIGNNLLKKTIPGAAADLYGMYTLLPSYTHEIPPPADIPSVMREGKFGALRVAPFCHRYLPKPSILADYLEMADERKIPVVFDTACGITLSEIWDTMERFPNLTAILAHCNIWPTDRYDRPFLAHFPNLRLDLSSMIIDQGIEKLVREFGASRLLFGSRFPYMYIGGVMLQLRRADISEEDKEAIAGVNLLKMIGEAKL